MSFDAVWKDSARPGFDALPVDARDQIEALVSAICANRKMGVPDLMEEDPALMGYTQIAVSGPAVVFYQVMDDVEIIRVVRVAWRS